MEKEFVSYEQAVVLNKLHYDGDYNYTYDIKKELWYGDIKADGKKYLAAPLKQQVFRWFREKYNLHYRITYYDPIKAIEFQADYQGFLYKTSAASFDGSLYLPHQSYWKLKDSPYSTYEEAENACIDKLIELAKQQDK